MFPRLRPFAATGVNGGEAVVSGGAELAVPRRLVEARIGGVELALQVAGKAEVVERFAGVGVRVAARLAADGAHEMPLGFRKTARVDEPFAVERVGAGVLGVALQEFVEICLWHAGRVAVLVKMFGGDEKLVRACDVGGGGRLRRHVALGNVARFRPRLVDRLFGRLGVCVERNQLHSVLEDGDLRGVGFKLDGMADLEIALFGRRGLRPSHQADFHAVNVLCRDDTGLAVLQADGEARIGVLYGAEILVRPPVLGEGLCFVWEKIREIRLVVGIDASHEFNVRAALVGEFAIPCVAEGMVAPRPLLLAGGNVAVGDVDEAAVRGVVIAAEEVVVRGAYHVRRRHGDVPVPFKVVRAWTRPVVDSVVEVLRDGEG